MGQWRVVTKTTKMLAVVVAVAGCATTDMKAESSAIAVGKSLVLQSVPLGGLAVQAAVSAGDGDDFGSYKYKTQLFCQTTKLESQGTGACYRLNVSEAVTVGSPDYLQFLVSKAGYETRLQEELPQMRKRGARVCLMEDGSSVVYRGYVEDFSEEKLKIAVAEAFLANSPSTRPTGFQPNTLWDYPVRWRLC